MKILKILSCCIVSLGCIYLYAGALHDDTVASEKVVESSVEAQLIEVPVVEQKIQLFMYDDCPYCVKVTNFLQHHNLMDKVVYIDAGVAENRELLRSISKRTQAPYLVDIDAGVSMPESLDIIAYLTKKFNVVASSVVDLSSGQSIQVRDAQKYDSSTFLSDVQASKQPVIILVSTTWCPPCKIFKPIFLRMAQQYADFCRFICIDGDTDAAIVDALGVRCYPSIVCYKNGKQINPENYRSQEGLQRLINQLLAD